MLTQVTVLVYGRGLVVQRSLVNALVPVQETPGDVQDEYGPSPGVGTRRTYYYGSVVEERQTSTGLTNTELLVFAERNVRWISQEVLR